MLSFTESRRVSASRSRVAAVYARALRARIGGVHRCGLGEGTTREAIARVVHRLLDERWDDACA